MYRYQYSFLLFVLVFHLSCKNNGKQTENTTKPETAITTDAGYLIMEGDSVRIPSFEIALDLSPEAEVKLKADKETVIVSAMFSGKPKDTTSDEYQFMGEISIQNYNVELTDQRIARFENVRFHSSVLNKLADKDISFLINVYSGRRSTENNILDCEFLQDKMSVITGKRIVLKGKLISEEQ